MTSVITLLQVERFGIKTQKLWGVYIYIYIYIERERERERKRKAE